MAAPVISHLSWGKIVVNDGGKELSFKDCKVSPAGAVAWDWRVTGTQHVPGTQPADIEELLNQGGKIVILSRGMENVLQVDPRTEEYLQKKGIQYHKENTKQAVELYNKLASEGAPVCGVFHSTC